MKRRKSILMVMLVMITVLFCLTGCGTQNYNLQINDDDSCIFDITISVNKDTYNLLSSYNIDTAKLNREKNTNTGTEVDNVDALFQEAALTLQQYEYTISAIDDSIDVGFSATKTYPTIAAFNEEIKTLKEIGLVGTDLVITKTEGTFETEYYCYGTLDYVIDKDVDFGSETISESFETLFDTSQLNCQLSVTMPYSTAIKASDGVYENGTLIWTNSYNNGATKEVHVISGIQNKQAFAILIVAIVVVIVILIIVGIKVAKILKTKKVMSEEYDEL